MGFNSGFKGLTLSELLLFAVTIFATVHIDGVNRLQYRGALLKKNTCSSIQTRNASFERFM